MTGKKKGQFICEKCLAVSDLYAGSTRKFFRQFMNPPKKSPKTCSACGQSVADYIAKHNLAISIIGQKNVGKSQFLSALKTIAPTLGMVTKGAATRKTLKQYYHKDDVKATAKLPERQSAEGASIDFSLDSTLLRFFDTAGEENADENTMVNTTKFIPNSDGIIILIDPFRLPKFKELNKRDDNSYKENFEKAPEDDMTCTFLDILQEHLPKDSDNKVKIPVAVVVSKMNLVAKYGEDEEKEYWEKFKDTARIDLVDQKIEGMESKIRAFLKTMNVETIIDSLEKNFAKYRLFGISSIEGIAVDMPIKWLLSQHNVQINKPKNNRFQIASFLLLCLFSTLTWFVQDIDRNQEIPFSYRQALSGINGDITEQSVTDRVQHGDMFYREGNLILARQSYEAALAMKERLVEEDSSELIKYLEKLATVYEKLDLGNLAFPLYDKAASIAILNDKSDTAIALLRKLRDCYYYLSDEDGYLATGERIDFIAKNKAAQDMAEEALSEIKKREAKLASEIQSRGQAHQNEIKAMKQQLNSMLNSSRQLNRSDISKHLRQLVSIADKWLSLSIISKEEQVKQVEDIKNQLASNIDFLNEGLSALLNLKKTSSGVDEAIAYAREMGLNDSLKAITDTRKKITEIGRLPISSRAEARTIEIQSKLIEVQFLEWCKTFISTEKIRLAKAWAELEIEIDNLIADIGSSDSSSLIEAGSIKSSITVRQKALNTISEIYNSGKNYKDLESQFMTIRNRIPVRKPSVELENLYLRWKFKDK